MSAISGPKNEASKPHAICIPYPLQGHLNPMLKLAKILHSKGFHITFVNTEFNHNRLLRSQGAAALEDRPSFRFRTIPDGLPPASDDAADSSQDVPSLCHTTETNCLVPFKELIARLNEAGDAPPVSCIVSDMAMFFTVDAAQDLGLPIILFWTASACGLLGYAQYQKLIDLGIFPFKEENFSTNGEMDAILDWIPAMEGIQMKDMPSFVRTTDPNDFMVNYLPRLIHKSKNALAIVFNSIEPLEQDVLTALSDDDFPPLYCLGPLQLLESVVVEGESNQEETGTPMSTSLWKEDPQCIEWLDKFEPNSVVYVNFGSVTVMTNDQLIEFAWGLANSNQPFLWITRPDLVIGSSAVLPPEFLEETKDKGLITSWCNQELVLSHPAIGGFLTHSGWNSTIETLINGLPVVCWPFFAEQQTNCWFSCNKWGIGMEIDANVKRSEVERQVRELMEGEKGEEMKAKAMEWKEIAYEVSSAPNGSSYNNLDKVINLLSM